MQADKFTRRNKGFGSTLKGCTKTRTVGGTGLQGISVFIDVHLFATDGMYFHGLIIILEAKMNDLR